MAFLPSPAHDQHQWPSGVAVAYGDVLEPLRSEAAMAECDTAFYLPRDTDDGMDALDAMSAQQFARSADRAGVEHVVTVADEPDDLRAQAIAATGMRTSVVLLVDGQGDDVVSGRLAAKANLTV